MPDMLILQGFNMDGLQLPPISIDLSPYGFFESEPGAVPTPIDNGATSAAGPVDTGSDPVPVDPTAVDPTPTDPAPSDPAPVDAGLAASGPVNSGPADPSPVDPTTPTDPTPPVDGGQPDAGPTDGGLVLSAQAPDVAEIIPQFALHSHFGDAWLL